MPSMKLALIELFGSSTTRFSAIAKSAPRRTSGSGSGSGVVRASTAAVPSATSPRPTQYAVNARGDLELSSTMM